LGLFTAAFLSASTLAIAERDQSASKASATAQIQEAAALAFQTPADSVEVRLGDKRLVLPDCSHEFAVSFPFNDRATTQLDCNDPSWRGFVQIRLGSGIGVFRYAMALEKGELLKRSHVSRHVTTSDVLETKPIVVLDDVLDRPIGQSVQAGEVVLERHFSGFLTGNEATSPVAKEQGAWVARQIIPRGNRLSPDSFTWELIEGRVPTDLVPANAEFAMLEALRDIMPGDNLRRSAVKMAPSVRKNEEIEVSLVRGALTVTNVVRVSRDATIGESIDVVNIESGRILKARVVGIGQVELL
jgi:flagella basal body P-ring formation protein FlgA